MNDKVCPSCASRNLSVFYEVRNIPAYSMLFSNHKEAINISRGDIRLAFCESCGFISNIAFIPSKLNYSSPTPEEQGFSATFNAFAQELARYLIETYDLHNKHVLEIGCGRGNFLELICRLGNNFGIGIDPSPTIGKIQSIASNRLTFIRDFYSDRYASYDVDLIICRHTLEHIFNTAEFLKIVRRAINKNMNAAVFFEVPDVARILNEAAFWDIYYEHCSYFNLGSLARLFRSCKFKVTNLKKGYFDQYLLLEAKAAYKMSKKTYQIEESTTETSRNIENFRSLSSMKLKFWKEKLVQFQKDKMRAIIWGSGSKCIGFMTTLNIRNEIDYVVDINPRRQGKFLPGVGKQIVHPEFLKEYKPDIVIAMNPVYCDEIRQSLETMDVTAELISCS